MKISDAELLIVPGWGSSSPDHWQSRWQAKFPSARRVEQQDWALPKRVVWAEAIVHAIDRAPRPVVLVAHSLGVTGCMWALKHARREAVRAALFVAPPSDERILAEKAFDPAFTPTPREKLPFPSLLIASRNDPYASFGWAEALAGSLGAQFADAGEAGHLNAESGHGPWPEGLMRFGMFLKEI